MAVGAVICLALWVLSLDRALSTTWWSNMVDVGEETGELDTMLYKVADNFDEESKSIDGRIDQTSGAIVGGVLGNSRWISLLLRCSYR